MNTLNQLGENNVNLRLIIVRLYLHRFSKHHQIVVIAPSFHKPQLVLQ